MSANMSHCNIFVSMLLSSFSRLYILAAWKWSLYDATNVQAWAKSTTILGFMFVCFVHEEFISEHAENWAVCRKLDGFLLLAFVGILYCLSCIDVSSFRELMPCCIIGYVEVCPLHYSFAFPSQAHRSSFVEVFLQISAQISCILIYCLCLALVFTF